MDRRRLMSFSALAVAAVAAPLLAVEPAGAFRDRDCSDFRSQRQAQRFYKRQRRKYGGDPHRLDADHDGVACESLR